MRQSELIKITLLVALSFLSACTKERRESSNPVTTPGGAATLSSLQADVLLGCAVSGCHDNRPTPAGSLNLSSYNASYDALVNKPSTQATGVLLVNPTDPGSSYLINKLQGTHLAVGGSGDRMPQFAAALSSADIDRFVTWIREGAQRN